MAEEKKNFKHKVLEMIEGGLRGSFSAWVFSWIIFILIILSNSFYLVMQLETPGPITKLIFTIMEIVTVALLTTEIALGFWTADIRYPGNPHPRLRHLRQPMTVIGILAILPFYLGGILEGSRFESIPDRIGFLTLLHLVKAWEIMWSSRTKKPSEDLKAE